MDETMRVSRDSGVIASSSNLPLPGPQKGSEPVQPGAGYFVVGGTLAPDAPCYVERRADQELFLRLSQGEFCYVLTSRQMGKSSLMVRTANRLRAQGQAVAIVDLTEIGKDVTPEQWYLGFLDRLCSSLRMGFDPQTLWLAQPRLGAWQRFARVLLSLVVRLAPSPVVVFIDEVDLVLSLPFSTDEFFAGLRAFYNLRAEDATYKRLTFCLVGVANPTDLIRDAQTTPFNVGRRIELGPFSREEVQQFLVGLLPNQSSLARSDDDRSRQGDPDRPGPTFPQSSTAWPRESAATEALLDRIVYWTGGQPYLTQRLCATVATRSPVSPPAGVDGVCADLFLESRARERDDNLVFVRKQLQSNPARLPAVLALYARVLKGRDVPDTETDPVTAALQLSGLVRAEQSRLRVANRIYGTVFDAAWVRRMTPLDELQRQRAAFWKGWIRSAAVFSALLVGVIFLAVYIAGLNRRLRMAVGDFQVRQGQEFIEANDVSSGLAYLADALREGRDDGAAYLRAVSALNQRGFALPTGVVFPHSNRVMRAAFDATGTLVATASRDRTARVWDTATGQPRTPWLRHGGEVISVQFDQSGARLLTACTNPVNQVAVWSAVSGEKLLALPLTNAVAATAFSPDGARIVTAGRHRIRVWDATSGQPVTGPFSASNLIQTVRFSPDSTKLMTTSNDPWVMIWDARTGRLLHLLSHPEAVAAARFDAQGQRVVTACADGLARIYDVVSGALLRQLAPEPHLGETSPSNGSPTNLEPHLPGAFRRPGLVEAQFDPTGRLFVTATQDATAQIWDAEQYRQLFWLPHEEQVVLTEFSSDGLMLLTVCLDEEVRVWDCLTGRLLVQPFKFYTFIGSVAFHPTRRQLLIASGDVTGRNFDQLAVTHSAQLWDLRVTAGFGLPIAHATAVTDVAFTPDGAQAVSADAGGGVKVSDREQGVTLRSMQQDRAPVSKLALSADGDRVLTVRGSNRVEVGHAPDWRPLASRTYPGTNAIYALLSRAGDRVASASSNLVTVWNVGNGEVEFEEALPETVVTALALSPDSQWLLAGAADETVHRWHRPDVLDWTAWTTLASLRFTNSIMQQAEFSPDSRRVLSAHRDEVARVWWVEDGASATGGALLKMDRPVKHAEFSPDGSKVLTIGGRKVRIWDAATAAALTETFHHRAEINSAHFSPDGKFALTASEDGTARLWDTRTGLEIADPLRHDGPVVQARFSPDTRWLLTASSDKTARLWQTPFTSGLGPILPQLLEAVAGRNLTDQQIFSPVHRTNLLAFQGSSKPALANPSASQWLKWFFADPATRSISPGAAMTVPDYVTRLIALDTPASLQEALRLQPTNQEARVRLAGKALRMKEMRQ